MKVVISAGGLGERIRPISSDIPKPMISIAGVPVLERIICQLKRYKLTDIIITTGYLSDVIINYFGDGINAATPDKKNFGVNIDYYVEESPLGTAGALFPLKDKLGKDFILINGDIVFDIDWNRLIEYHLNNKTLVTIVTHPNNHPYDSNIVVTNENGIAVKLIDKTERRNTWYKNNVNAGIHVMSSLSLEVVIKYLYHNNTVPFKSNLDKDILKPLISQGKVACYKTSEYIRDMGSVDRFESISHDIISGIVEKKCLHHSQKAVFLDRDGTINEYVGFLSEPDQFNLLPGVADAIKIINSVGYLAIVITNQPVIARGDITMNQLEVINNKMETLLGEQGAYLDDILICPHHPDAGFIGEVTELKIECRCRKPKPGLLYQAANQYNIDLCNSWMIGDSKCDIDAGQAAGCFTALIGKGEYGQSITGSTLLDIIQSINFD